MTARAKSPARHHWIVRLTHWVNAVAFTIMVGSGLRIFNAYPAFARKGETFCCYPFEGMRVPAWLTFGAWLGGARHWHFAMMWVLVATGVVYLSFIYLHGEWRDLVPRRGDWRDAIEMVRFYLYARKDHPRHGKHNALQKATYFAMPLVAAVIVVSGVAIWKPVSLAWLTNALGGYVWARYWHFMAMFVLVAMSVVHVFMVIAVDPYSLRSMTTGGHNDELSPIARNARPFRGLFRKGSSAARLPEAQEPHL
ncbi:MAG: cytochrome b/b6 domain-containing protein [Gemmatimonadaceae bacterium]|nr:cytochrome b/b6 domain-containing protein [Gemmatimonadaceae bacterium]